MKWLVGVCFSKDIPHGVFADTHENNIQEAIDSEPLSYIGDSNLLEIID